MARSCEAQDQQLIYDVCSDVCRSHVTNSMSRLTLVIVFSLECSCFANSTMLAPATSCLGLSDFLRRSSVRRINNWNVVTFVVIENDVLFS